MKKITLVTLLGMGLPACVFAEAAAGPAAAPNPMGQGVMLAGFILIFYFLIWRPQNKRAKQHRNLVASLSKGDEIVTTGGLMGQVIRVHDNYLVLVIADGIEVKVQRQAVSAALPKGTLSAL